MKKDKEGKRGEKESRDWPPKDKMIRSDGDKKNKNVVKKGGK